MLPWKKEMRVKHISRPIFLLKRERIPPRMGMEMSEKSLDNMFIHPV